MSLNYATQVQEIKTQITSQVTNARIVDTLGSYPEVAGVIQPHVVLNIGGPVESARGKGIVGTAKNPHILWCHVHCVALTVGEARDLKGDVIDALAGFDPTGSGEMVLRGGFDQTLRDTDNSPVLFDEVARFEFTFNL